MIVEDHSIVLSDDGDSLPERLFFPFQRTSCSLDCPMACATFLRMRDGKFVTLEIFKNKVVSSSQEAEEYIMLDINILFGYDVTLKKLWFKNSENLVTQFYQSQSQRELQLFVEQLKNKCPQYNFLQRYEFVEKTGNGSKSQVYTARRLSDQTIFAVKVQKYNLSLKRQIQILQQLQHPNIIYFRQYFFESDNKVYLVMDFQDGGCLLDIIQSNSHISSKQKVKIFTDMLNALEFLRIKGIVHRDLKPENILYSKKDKIYKIADFGMSRKQGQKLDRVSGTPGYMAPQALNSQPNVLQADTSSDIYSMGLVFYEILTYKQYYSGDNPQQIIRKNKQSLSLKKKEIDSTQIKELEYSLLEKMIRTDPSNRKNSCQILKSSTFSKLNKIHGLQYLSSTSPSKKMGSATKSEKEIDDSIVQSFWKLLRMKSWSN